MDLEAQFIIYCKLECILVENNDMDDWHHSPVNEAELERLKHALKLLSEAEKQLRVSSERSTWFTATLLQLGSVHSPDLTQSGSSRRQSSKTTEEDPSSSSREVTVYKQKSGAQYMARNSTSPASLHEAVNRNSSHQGEVLSRIDGHSSYSKPPPHGRLKDGSSLAASHNTDKVGNMIITCRNSEKLGDIWAKCIERCHSKTLKQLLWAHAKLWSISEVEGKFISFPLKVNKRKNHKYIDISFSSAHLVDSNSLGFFVAVIICIWFSMQVF